MPSDLKLTKNSEGVYDINFVDGDFELTQGLDTALLMSIFGENRANSDQVQDPLRRRGHFSNSFSKVKGFELGSLVWFFTEQRAVSDENSSDVKNAIRKSLQWLIDDSIIDDAQVSIEVINQKYAVRVDLKSISQQDSQYFDPFKVTFS